MSEAKCTKCGGHAIGDTFEQARNKINHAVGLSRGIKCGDNYGQVKDVNAKPKEKSKEKPTKEKSQTLPKEKTNLPKEKISENTVDSFQ